LKAHLGKLVGFTLSVKSGRRAHASKRQGDHDIVLGDKDLQAGRGEDILNDTVHTLFRSESIEIGPSLAATLGRVLVTILITIRNHYTAAATDAEIRDFATTVVLVTVNTDSALLGISLRGEQSLVVVGSILISLMGRNSCITQANKTQIETVFLPKNGHELTVVAIRGTCS
jgi:predicted nuclease of predicted toxin-antitoxin system